MLEAEQRAQNVGIKRGGIALCSLIDDQTGLSLGTGDVDGHIEAAEAGYGLVDQPSDFVIVTDIGLDEDGLRAEPLQLDCEGLTLGRRRPLTTRRAPILANAKAVARPMPVRAQ